MLKVFSINKRHILVELGHIVIDKDLSGLGSDSLHGCNRKKFIPNT